MGLTPSCAIAFLFPWGVSFGSRFVGFVLNEGHLAMKARPEQWGTPHAQAPAAG